MCYHTSINTNEQIICGITIRLFRLMRKVRFISLLSSNFLKVIFIYNAVMFAKSAETTKYFLKYYIN